MDDLIAWLSGNVPADDGRVSIVHGDYRLDNMIFHPTEPRLLAVLDWELSTLGHPYADISYQCMQWRTDAKSIFSGLGGLDRKAIGVPTRGRICRRLLRARRPRRHSELGFLHRLQLLPPGRHHPGRDEAGA